MCAILISKALRLARGITQFYLPLYTFIHKWNDLSCLCSPTAEHHRTLVVLISRSAEDRRLSWPEWLGELVRWFIRRRR